jgi:hypothetical protein
LIERFPLRISTGAADLHGFPATKPSSSVNFMQGVDNPNRSIAPRPEGPGKFRFRQGFGAGLLAFTFMVGGRGVPPVGALAGVLGHESA